LAQLLLEVFSSASHRRDGTSLGKRKTKTAHTVVGYAGDLEAPCWVVFVTNRSGEVVTFGDITCISLGDEDFLSL
jgi:hypothetical protein